MGSEIYNKINDYFQKREYQQIPTDLDTVSMYGAFEKSNLYLINVIDLQSGYGLDMERYLEYKQMTMDQFGKHQGDKIVLLNVVLSDDSEKLSEEFNFVPDLSERFIDVVWFVDKEVNQLLIPSKMMKNVLGIQKDLKRLLKDESMVYYELKGQKSIAFMSLGLLIVNIVVWLYTEYIGGSTNPEVLLRMGAMYQPYILEEKEIWRMLTATFLHIGFLHLFHNMFGLYIFGYRLEKYLKPWQFAVIYFGSGIIGSVTSLTVSVVMNQVVISAGASGAVYGLMGSMLVITKILKRPIDGVNTYVIWVMFIIGIIQSFTTPGVDVSAHIGGFVGGILMTFLTLKSSVRTD